MKRFIIFLIVAAVIAGGGWYWWSQSKTEKPRSYKTAKADRGPMVQTVKATGVVQPVLTVLVGTQVNGPVQKLYVDFNSRVKAGDLVAQIDPSVYKARAAQDQANLQQAMAALDESTARMTQAEKELARSRELAKRDLLSQSDLDAAVASRDTLAAQVKVSEASVEQARAALQVSSANLSYTTIRAPVDGVVIARNVSEGQTVVASMTAQTLFQIATDLKKMQVEASIPEADIGNLREGQTVVFTVDAYDTEFTGTVSQIRLAASTMQNVVTYPVVINADNPGEKLFPGMTANISCEVARREEALRVPNAALRFKPDASDLVPATGGSTSNAAVSGGGSREGGSGRTGSGGGFRSGGKPGGEGGLSRSRQKVWVLDEATQKPRSVSVHLGINDGINTEIRERPKTEGAPPADAKDSQRLQEGDEVVIGYNDSNGGSGSSQAPVNPFAPPRPGGGRPR